MEISHPHAQDPTPEQTQELEKLKGIIERAIKDGIITRTEFNTIKQEILISSKGSADQFSRELELYRTLVTEKVKAGELEIET